VTAVRWWVRRLARWIARVNGVKAHIQMLSLAVTAFSTFSIMLQGFGLGRYIPYFGVGGVLVGVLYTYLYTEGGVWNQVQRDQADLSNNYADPNSRINAEMSTRALLAGLLGRPPTDEEVAAVQTELDTAFQDLRDGIDIEASDAGNGGAPADD
jgi:hypothetical protein